MNDRSTSSHDLTFQHAAPGDPGGNGTRSGTWSLARRTVAGFGAAFASLLFTHAGAAVLRSVAGDGEAPLAAATLSMAAVAVAFVGALALPRRAAPVFAAAGGLAAAFAVDALHPGAFVAALALPPVAAAATLLARWIGGRLPARLENAAARRRFVAAVWLLVSAASLVQMGRLATFTTDRDASFYLLTDNPFWHGHECLPAYLYAAELAQRGEGNLYHPSHYPGLDAEAAPRTELAMTVEDPFQYPPQFLLLPTAALAVTKDMTVLRTGWLALQVSLFAGAFAALALFVGGRGGRLALWLLPTVLMTLPMLFNFQFGQFHLPALALAVLAMLAFHRHRAATGGLLMATAILAKVFPLVLLVPLAVKRRFQELAWTFLWGSVLSAVALLVLGPAPFVAFLDYQLPRLSSGAAFAFDEAWPEIAGLVVADNQGFFGLARKAGLEKSAAALVGRVASFGVLALAGLWAWRERRASPFAHATSWLALLGLASLASPGAWGDYVTTTAVWLLALVASKAIDEPRWRWPLAITAVMQATLLGTMPIGDAAPLAVMVPVSAVGALTMLGLYGAVLRPGLAAARRREEEPDARLDVKPAPSAL